MASSVTLRMNYREFIGFERALARQLAAYRQQRPDVNVEFKCSDIPPLYEEMVAQGAVFTDRYDLFLAVTDWMPELIKRGAVTRLNEFLQAEPPPDWPEGWSPSMLTLQQDDAGGIYGMPYHDGPEVFMYRTDLFGDERERERFRRQYGRDLAVPETWSQFLDIAKFFTRPDEDLYGCVVAAKPDGHNNVYDFCIHMWTRGGQFFDERLRPTFNGPAAVEGLQFLCDLINTHRVTQPDPLEFESVASGNFYASGRAAMMWNWCGFQAVADTPDLSRIPGRTRSTMMPAGDGPGGRHASLSVYWVLTIPSGSRQKQEAWRFMRHLATPEMDKITSLEGGTGTRLSTWRDPEVRRLLNYYEVIEEVHRHVEHMPRLPEYPAINEVLSQAIYAAETGRKTPQQALDEAAGEAEAILGRAGYYR